MALVRFWFEFDATDPLPAGLRMGCGVTASSIDDATRLLADRVFKGASIPAITRVVQDVDIGSLDAGHVRPNMGVPVLRGVWFPLGY
jgi:hypothetical protein